MYDNFVLMFHAAVSGSEGHTEEGWPFCFCFLHVLHWLEGFLDNTVVDTVAWVVGTIF